MSDPPCRQERCGGLRTSAPIDAHSIQHAPPAKNPPLPLAVAVVKARRSRPIGVSSVSIAVLLQLSFELLDFLCKRFLVDAAGAGRFLIDLDIRIDDHV